MKLATALTIRIPLVHHRLRRRSEHKVSMQAPPPAPKWASKEQAEWWILQEVDPWHSAQAMLRMFGR